jgi:DNA invertase Pin-like site-specific DNA recombinase
MVQEVGFAKLQALGIKLVAADSPHSFLDDTPTSKLIRQILGAVSEFDKAMVVAKLKGARDRQRALNGKCEGRKSHAEMHPETQRVDLQDTWRRAYNPVRAQSHYRGADRRGSFRVLLLGHPQG